MMTEKKSHTKEKMEGEKILYGLSQYHDVDEVVPPPPAPSWTLPKAWETVNAGGLVRHRRSGRLLVLCRRRPMYGYDEAKAVFVHLGTGHEHKEHAPLRYTR